MSQQNVDVVRGVYEAFAEVAVDIDRYEHSDTAVLNDALK